MQVCPLPCGWEAEPGQQGLGAGGARPQGVSQRHRRSGLAAHYGVSGPNGMRKASPWEAHPLWGTRGRMQEESAHVGGWTRPGVRAQQR